MAARTVPPFRADHVGSLLRPQRLHKAREDFAAGRIKAEDLRAVEDDAIREVVKMQEDVGLQSATDGEFRRATWHMDFIYQLGGLSSAADEQLEVHFHNADGDLDFKSAALKVSDKVRLNNTIFGDHFSFLKAATTATTPTTCTCATSRRSTRRWRTSRTTWPSPRTCAAATSSRRGWRPAGTTSWPRRCSANWPSTAS